MLFKFAVFTVMAAMLAWILGGTLFPRPVTAIQKDIINVRSWTFAWEAEIQPEHATLNWYLARYGDLGQDGPWERVAGGGPFQAVEPLQASTLGLLGDVLFTTHVWIVNDDLKEGEALWSKRALVVQANSTAVLLLPESTSDDQPVVNAN